MHLYTTWGLVLLTVCTGKFFSGTDTPKKNFPCSLHFLEKSLGQIVCVYVWLIRDGLENVPKNFELKNNNADNISANKTF